jgi:DNA-binding IclR family transcriptional regulator
VLSRALAVLDTFSPDNPSLRLVEVSRKAGLPVSTVVRILSQLCEWKALERTNDLRYRIGPRLGELAALRSPRKESGAIGCNASLGLPTNALIAHGRAVVELTG